MGDSLRRIKCSLTWKVVDIAALTGYAAYELERQHEHSSSSFARSFNSAVHQIVQGAGGVSQYALNEKLDTAKKKAREEPKNLAEQLALEEAKENEGKQIMQDKINDPKYPREEWKKMQHNHESLDNTNIELHYWENVKNGEKTGFKFKDYQ